MPGLLQRDVHVIDYACMRGFRSIVALTSDPIGRKGLVHIRAAYSYTG